MEYYKILIYHHRRTGLTILEAVSDRVLENLTGSWEILSHFNVESITPLLLPADNFIRTAKLRHILIPKSAIGYRDFSYSAAQVWN